MQTQGQVTLSLCGAKGAALGDYLASEEPPTDPAGGCLWLDTAGELPVLRQYGESGWSIREDTYIKIAAGGIGVGFAAGDGVVIEGCREESLNGSHVLEAAEDGALVVPGDDRRSGDPDGGTDGAAQRAGDGLRYRAATGCGGADTV